MESETKTLLVRGSLFLLPLVLAFGFFTAVLQFTGEWHSIRKIIERQQSPDAPVLAGLAYSNPDAYFKLQSVLAKRPKIIALGTSRSMQFRSKFFKDSTAFYNAGGGVEKISHFKEFLGTIPDGNKPKIIIAGFDQYFFNEHFDRLQEDGFSRKLTAAPNRWAVWQNGVKGLIKDYARKKFSLKNIFSAHEGRIGLNAIVNDNGFLNDGSYYYGKIYQDPTAADDYQFKDTFKRIEKGIKRFEYGDKVAKKALEKLEAFLAESKKRNIHVIGFLPPYAHAVYEKMSAMKERYGYVFGLHADLAPVFARYGFTFYDFSDIKELGASDAETTDGFHGSEKAYLRMFIFMAKDDTILRQEADVELLEQRLKQSTNHHYIFSINEL